MSRQTSRRTLLKAAVAAAGAPLIVPSRVLGRLAPSNQIHLAHFGCGSRGSDVLKGFAHNADCRYLVAVDPFKSRREATARYLGTQYGDATAVSATADFREVLARPDIDAVVLCTSDHWHVPLAILACASGKDVYVEKPLSPSLAWSKRLRAVAMAHDRIVQYGTQQRSGSTFRYACQLVRNGYLGRLKHVDAWCIDGTRAREWMTAQSTVPEPVPADLEYDVWQGPAPAAPYNRYRVHREGAFHCYDYSIGFLGGWGAHPLDITHWGMDADHTGPSAVQGVGKIPTVGLYSTVYDWDVHFTYASGVTMHFMCDRIAQPVVGRYRKRASDHGTTFFGEDGWLSVDRGGLEASDPKFLDLRFKPADVRLPASSGHDRNFLDCIRTRQQPLSNLEAAIRSDTLSHLSDVAVRLKRKLAWDPAAERFADDDVANRFLNRAMRAPYQF